MDHGKMPSRDSLKSFLFDSVIGDKIPLGWTPEDLRAERIQAEHALWLYNSAPKRFLNRPPKGFKNWYIYFKDKDKSRAGFHLSDENHRQLAAWKKARKNVNKAFLRENLEMIKKRRRYVPWR